jgi:hypothetical protein
VKKAISTILWSFIRHKINGWLCVSLPMRLVSRSTKSLYMCVRIGYQISITDFRSYAWPHWYSKQKICRTWIFGHCLKCGYACRGDKAILWVAGRRSEFDRAVMSQMKLSARAYHHILKLARTIADLAGSEDVQSAHLAEAYYLANRRLEFPRSIGICILCWSPLLKRCNFYGNVH